VCHEGIINPCNVPASWGQNVAGSGIVIDGLATVFLNGASTYTGTTTINRGRLQLGASDVLPNGSAMLLGTGGLTPSSVPTLATSGLSDTVGTLTVGSDNGVLDLGSGASALHFAASGGQAWNGTLTVTNWTAFSDHIFAGASALGLTAGQLSQINFAGHLFGARFAAIGEVDPTPYVIKGDFNQDGFENSNDIPAMLQALTDIPRYQNTYGMTPSELISVTDMNGDNALTNRDIQNLLDVLAGGGSAAPVHEPSSALLAGGGLIGLARVYRRRSAQRKCSTRLLHSSSSSK
jgi:autotransporter-associated beta strand protein